MNNDYNNNNMNNECNNNNMDNDRNNDMNNNCDHDDMNSVMIIIPIVIIGKNNANCIKIILITTALITTIITRTDD